MFVHFKSLLFKPGENVKSALETPNLGLGIFFIIISSILGLIYAVQVGISLNPTNIGFGLLKGIIGWLIASAILYFAILLLKGKTGMPKGFSSIASAVSISFVYFSLFSLILIISTMFFTPPAYLSVMKVSLNEKLSEFQTADLLLILEQKNSVKLQQFISDNLLTTESRQVLEDIVNQNQPVINGYLLSILSLLQLLLGIFFALLLIPYKIISQAGKFGIIGNLVLLVLVLFIMSFVGNVYSTISF
ncbi:MAG: hypothetical protein Q7S92_04920 [Candidatus Diapherotrites archaeon]|nr:hypothetical protein [Candidatus Diapherotrites archaeon]